MALKWCLFNRNMAFNGQRCLLIDISDVHLSLTVRFRTVGPQTPSPLRRVFFVGIKINVVYFD